MIEFKRILCPVDVGEQATGAIAYAAALAQRYEAELTVLHVVPTFTPVQVPSRRISDPVSIVQPVSRDDVVAALAQVLESAGIPARRASLVAEAGDAARTIVDQAVARRADLVVVGTHGRRGLDRFFLGSVAEEVLRKAPCPVLTVPPHAPERAYPDVVFQTILCPVDLSPASLQAFGFARDLARQAAGTLVLLQAVEWLPEHEPRTYAHFNVAEYRGHLVEESRKQLDELITKEPAGCTTETVVVIGRAYREILRTAAERSPDLIVMGAQGRGEPGLALFGSTTQQVVRAATCPVLTARSPAAT